MESEAARGRQLREDIYRFVGERQTVRKAEILTKFSADEPVLIAWLLRDLVASELVFASGSGATTAYRIARSEELATGDDNAEERLQRLLWIVIQRLGPIDRKRLMDVIPAEDPAIDKALSDLTRSGRVEVVERDDGADLFRSDECFIPPEDPAGWEAAVFDHFQAVVATLTARLRRGTSDPMTPREAQRFLSSCGRNIRCSKTCSACYRIRASALVRSASVSRVITGGMARTMIQCVSFSMRAKQ